MRERPPTNDRRAAWERNAAAWLTWARDRELDGHYWLYHRDLFLELVPAPAGRTLDLGCGEGRLAREGLREVRLPEHALRNARAARWTRIPLFLHLRAVKPAG